MKKNYAIEINNISKVYKIGEKVPYYSLRDSIVRFFKKIDTIGRDNKKPFWALRGVNLKIESGDIVGIIGKNGAGKSTLLKILSRVTTPTKGEIIINGSTASLLEVGTGFHPELTGEENIFLSGTIIGMSRTEIKRKLPKIVEFSGIGKFLHTQVKHYSSGMYVRLAFAVGAFLESDVLFIDEVLAVGDSEFQKKCLGTIERMSQDKKRTVVFVSHNLALVRQICNKTAVLDKGKVIYYGPTQKAISHYLQNDATDKKLASRKDRSGSGEIYITDIYFCDANNHRILSWQLGETVSVHFKYKVRDKSKISKPIIGFILRNDFGQPVLFHSNRLKGVTFDEFTESGEFVCELDRITLAPGRYNLTYSLLAHNGLGGQYYDNIEAAIGFDVEPGDFYGTGELPLPEHYVLTIDGNWMIKNAR